jgi:hypothetical protein
MMYCRGFFTSFGPGRSIAFDGSAGLSSGTIGMVAMIEQQVPQVMSYQV